jgi:hypothetical protein
MKKKEKFKNFEKCKKKLQINKKKLIWLEQKELLNKVKEILGKENFCNKKREKGY